MKEPLIFSESSIFYLQKLAHDFHSVTGVRHKLSNENSMLSLLKSATVSNNRAVRRDLDKFTADLAPDQINALMGQGVALKQRRAY